MLKITIQHDPDLVTMKLEGRVMGPWVDEVSRSWHSLEPLLGSKELSLDLRGVSFVDVDGRQLLHEIYDKTHAGFLTDSPITKYYAEQAMQ
jgi:hypothetical protein